MARAERDRSGVQLVMVSFKPLPVISAHYVDLCGLDLT